MCQAKEVIGTITDRAERLLNGSSFMEEGTGGDENIRPTARCVQNTGVLGGSGVGWQGPWCVDQTLVLWILALVYDCPKLDFFKHWLLVYGSRFQRKTLPVSWGSQEGLGPDLWAK